MPKRFVAKNTTATKTRVLIQDATSPIGAGKTGLTYASGLTVSYHLASVATPAVFALGAGTTGTTTTGTVAAPTAPTPAVSTTGGTIAAATHYGVATYVNAAGETVGSTQLTWTATGTTSSVTIPSPAAVSGASGWRYYDGTVTGGPYTLQGATLALGTALTIVATPTTGGINPPVANTAVWYGISEIDPVRQPGHYQISLPDAMWSASEPILFVIGPGIYCTPSEFQLTGADFSASTGATNAILSYGTGAGEIATDGAGNVKILAVNGLAPPANWSAMVVNAGDGGVTVHASNDKAGYTLATAPPTAAAIATAVWTDTTAGDFTVASSPGKTVLTNLDTNVGSRSTYVGGAVTVGAVNANAITTAAFAAGATIPNVTNVVNPVPVSSGTGANQIQLSAGGVTVANLPNPAPTGYGGSGGTSVAQGIVQPGTTTTTVILQGSALVPTNGTYNGQRLYHPATGQSRVVANHTVAGSGPYTHAYTFGTGQGEQGPFTQAPGPGDAVIPIP